MLQIFAEETLALYLLFICKNIYKHICPTAALGWGPFVVCCCRAVAASAADDDDGDYDYDGDDVGRLSRAGAAAARRSVTLAGRREKGGGRERESEMRFASVFLIRLLTRAVGAAAPR